MITQLRLDKDTSARRTGISRFTDGSATPHSGYQPSNRHNNEVLMFLNIFRYSEQRGDVITPTGPAPATPPRRGRTIPSPAKRMPGSR